MKSKIFYYAKEIVIFFIVMTVIANLLSLYKSNDLNKAPLQISEFRTIDNTTFIIDKSKPILIHFWATWCPTCKVEASNIQTISENFDVLTIAVRSGSNQEIQTFLDDNNLNYPTFNDFDSKLASEFQIAAYPTTFIYDKEQKLVFSEVGYTSTWGLWLRMWWASL